MTSIDPKNVRNQLVSFRASPEGQARIAAAAAEAGVGASAWLRDLLLEHTPYQDMARRRAPRRANRQPPNAAGGELVPVVRVSQRERAAIEKQAARARMSVTEWAWSVVEAELEKEGQ